MADLKCTKCGTKAGYADASIADSHGTCGSDGRPAEVETPSGYVKYAYGGEKHDWEEL